MKWCSAVPKLRCLLFGKLTLTGISKSNFLHIKLIMQEALKVCKNSNSVIHSIQIVAFKQILQGALGFNERRVKKQQSTFQWTGAKRNWWQSSVSKQTFFPLIQISHVLYSHHLHISLPDFKESWQVCYGQTSCPPPPPFYLQLQDKHELVQHRHTRSRGPHAELLGRCCESSSYKGTAPSAQQPALHHRCPRAPRTFFGLRVGDL